MNNVVDNDIHDPDLEARLKAEVSAFKDVAKRGLVHMMNIGDILIEAKDKYGEHTRWTPWLNQHFPYSNRTARRFMQLAKHRMMIELKMATLAVLADMSATAALKLIGQPDVDMDAIDITPVPRTESPPPIKTEPCERGGNTYNVTPADKYVTEDGKPVDAGRQRGTTGYTPAEDAKTPEAQVTPHERPVWERPPPPTPEEQATSQRLQEAWDAFDGIKKFLKFLLLEQNTDLQTDPRTAAENLKYEDDDGSEIDDEDLRKEALSKAETCIEWLTNYAEALRQTIPASDSCVAPAPAQAAPAEAETPIEVPNNTASALEAALAALEAAPNMADRRRANAALANVLGLHDLAEEVENAYAGRVRTIEKELLQTAAERTHHPAQNETPPAH